MVNTLTTIYMSMVSYFASGSGTSCGKPTFFGLEPWYQYLKLKVDPVTNICTVDISFTNSAHWNDIWLIALAVFDDLLRIAALVAIGFVIVGGIQYLTSQGEPSGTNQARNTIIHALVGLVIAIVAATTVSFIGNSLGG